MEKGKIFALEDKKGFEVHCAEPACTNFFNDTSPTIDEPRFLDILIRRNWGLTIFDETDGEVFLCPNCTEFIKVRNKKLSDLEIGDLLHVAKTDGSAMVGTFLGWDDHPILGQCFCMDMITGTGINSGIVPKDFIYFLRFITKTEYETSIQRAQHAVAEAKRRASQGAHRN